MLYHNIHTMIRQCCVNIVWMLVPNIEIRPNYNIWAMLSQHHGNDENHVCLQCWTPTLKQHSYNVAWALVKHWSPTLGTKIEIRPNYNIWAMLSQHCGNVENYVSPQRWTPMLKQHSHNVCLISPHCWKWRCHNIHTTLPECCPNVGWRQWQCSHNVVWTSKQRYRDI